MRIDAIKLSNFRNYVNLETQFGPGVNLLIGINGSGKTTILEAISILAGAYLIDNPLLGGKFIDQGTDPHLQYDALNETFLKRYPVELEATWNREIGNKINWKLSLTREKGHTRYIDAESIYSLGKMDYNCDPKDQRILPLISYYSTARMFTSANVGKSNMRVVNDSVGEAYEPSMVDMELYTSSDDRPNHHARFEGYFRCLDKENIIKHIRRWWQDAQNDQSPSPATANALENLGKSLNYTLARLMGTPENYTKIKPPKFGSTGIADIIFYPEDGRAKPLFLFSDGFKAILYLIADLVLRTSLLNPTLLVHETEFFSLINVVVMIDEIDLHLHPRWQQLIIPLLEELFPNVQFFITSHSPSVLGSSAKMKVFALSENNILPLENNHFGKEANYNLLQNLGAPARLPEIQAKIDNLLAKVDQLEINETEEFENQLNALESLLGADDPELVFIRSIFDFNRQDV